MSATGHWSATFFVCYTGHERGKQGSLARINMLCQCLVTSQNQYLVMVKAILMPRKVQQVMH